MTVAITAAINGFQPARQYTSDMVYTYPVTNGASDTLAIGDAVSIVNGLAVKLALTDSPSAPVAGVVVGLRNAQGRALTFDQPTNGPFLGNNETGFAQVLINSEMTYLVRLTGTAATGSVGDNVRANDAGVTVSTGISGMSVRALAGADATTTPFKIIALSDQLVAGGAGADRYVEVALNNTWRRAGTLGQ